MLLSRLKIINVRNHKNSIYNLHNENIVIGENGSGKTTILESIYLLFAMRGFKKQPIAGTVTFGETFLRIEAIIEFDGSEHNLALKYDGQKCLYLDDAPVEKVSNYIYDFPISCYTPDSLGILSPSQKERRNFIDRFIFYTDKNYIDDIKLYNRFLSQKSAAFESNKIDETYIDILNDKIIELSKIISEKRFEFIERINKLLKQTYSCLEFPMENVLASYKTNSSDYDILKREKYSKRCDYGIHRDKIDMCMGAKIIEKFSSIGQKKTFILLCLHSALKDVEIKRKFGIITLLDDFEATLDKKRASFLKDIFSAERQTIFTGVENTRLNFKNVINL